MVSWKCSGRGCQDLVVAARGLSAAVSHRYDNEKDRITYSGVSRRRNKSIAAENAAKAIAPPNAAFGPELRARMPPETNPAAIAFVISFLARYYSGEGFHSPVRSASGQ